MPRPAVLSCEKLSKSFGAAALFDGLTFSVHEGDHVGLVGPNGAGKSTLLKLLAGLEEPDTGSCSRRKGIRVGYVPQSPAFPAGLSAEQVVEGSFGNISDEYERHQRVREALSRTGFTDPGVKTDVLSGGWRARLAIARELALSPDILLLDEPTNHLDIESILWLEELLRNDMVAFVAVSHDRYFLDNIANRMLEVNRLHPSGLFQANGSYADFLEARDEQLRNQAAYQDSLAGLVRREVTWLRRGAKARTTKSKARIQSAERSIEQLDQSRARTAVRTAAIEFSASGRRTKELWGCRNLGMSFGESSLFTGLDLQLGPGSRLGVLGPNGSGKTTLLRIIVGESRPTSGSIQRAENLRVVYFDQHRESLDPSLSLKRALAPEADSVIYRDRPLHVASWAKRFLFRPEQLETPVGSLSGGERARIVIARMMLQPADLLVLDEPTNDLDIPALDVLEESLLDFPGALVLVTHDRYLIDRVSTQILALSRTGGGGEGGGRGSDGQGEARHFADYDQWEANRRNPAQAKRVRTPASIVQSAQTAPSTQTAKPAGRRLTYLEQREWDGLEAAVLEAESKAAEARRLAEDPAIASDASLLQRRHADLADLQLKIDRLYARWAELEEKRR